MAGETISGIPPPSTAIKAAAGASSVQTNDQGSSSVNGTSSSEWSPSSWTSKPVKQDVVYTSRPAVEKSLAKLNHLPPIVHPSEIERLKASLRDVALGNAFLLQGGDCAELFSYCSSEPVENKIKLLLQMSLILLSGFNKKVVRIARMAGQYAKPRSSPTEKLADGREVPSFRGDILNGFDLSERELDPERLVQAYFHSAATLNFVRASLASGFADLHRPLDWELGHVRDEQLQKKYEKIVGRITDSLEFMKTVGAAKSRQLETVDLFTSHEGLLLEYEQALTRQFKVPTKDPAAPPMYHDSPTPKAAASNEEEKAWYNTSAHFLWIGDRTRQPDGGHVEYFRGIANPMGVKIGPTTTTESLLELLHILNPTREIGKITLITRYGCSKVASLLPAHIRAVEAPDSPYKRTVVWQCDPMHGNTRSTATGVKTRRFEDILSELKETVRIHKEEGSYLGGVHLELTGEAVTECVGGGSGLAEEGLGERYETFCDPRLNEKQALEMAFELVGGHEKD